MMGNVKRPRVSASEEFAAVVRKAVRRHPESNYKKSSATKQLFYK